jgi:undecaprenyl-diphosphatase
MIQWLESVDRDLFLWLNGLHQPWLDQPMYYISEELTWLPVYIILIWGIIKAWGWKVLLWSFIAVALVVTLCDRISVEFFKNVFLRYRPSRNIELAPLVHIVNDYRGGLYGFISSHAANFFGIATFLFFLLRTHFPKGAPWLIVWAALIAYSRIYLGVHYPADIAVGALLGIFIGWLVYRLFKKLLLLRT